MSEPIPYREVTPAAIEYRSRHSIEEDGAATITVKPRCMCGSVRWFECRCPVGTVTYTCAGIDQTGAPCLDFLRAVVNAHPGCDYVFTPVPLYLREQAQAIVNGRG